jgi:hypothetical protein
MPSTATVAHSAGSIPRRDQAQRSAFPLLMSNGLQASLMAFQGKREHFNALSLASLLVW